MPYTARSWPEVRERLKDRYEGVPFWEDDEARAAFNEGLHAWNLLVGWWKRRLTLPTVSDSYDYTLPASLVYRTRLEYNSQPMSPSGREDLNNGRYNWRMETTTSGGDVPTRPMLWAPVSLRRIYIWPADAVAGNTILLDGVSATPTMADANTAVDLGDDLLDVLLGYALHALSFKKGAVYFEATVPLFQAFLKMAAEENGQIKTSVIYRRYMGLDRRDAKRLRGTPTRLDLLAGPR